jgi:monoamine oxidase
MKSPLLSTLRRVWYAAQSERSVEELLDIEATFLDVEMRRKSAAAMSSASVYDPHLPSRRAFLRTSAQAGFVLGGLGWIPNSWGDGLDMGREAHFNATEKNKPRVAIVGAGIGGLAAGWYLQKAGINATIYENRSKAGGRIQTIRRYGNGQLNTEAGAEFIDTTHKDLRALVRELGLELLDVEADPQPLQKEVFHIGGQRRTPADLLVELKSAMPFIRKSQQGANGARKVYFDKLPLSEYIEQLPVNQWVKTLFDIAYCAENGLDVGNQSSLNMLSMFRVTDKEWLPYGDSDERYKVRGGNDLITTRLAERLKDQIRYEHDLMAIKEAANGTLSLTFNESKTGTSKTYDFDAVILTVPFSALNMRNTLVGLDLPPLKKRIISELGYGTNAKAIVETKSRHWRSLGYRGNLFNEGVMNGWDSSHQQLNNEGVGTYTALLGGQRGVPRLFDGKVWQGMQDSFAGIDAQTTGFSDWICWRDSYALGSYSCLRPGQTVEFEGAAFAPVRGLYFAGEHCSTDFWGFMNGAVESAKRAVALIGKRKRRR